MSERFRMSHLQICTSFSLVRGQAPTRGAFLMRMGQQKLKSALVWLGIELGVIVAADAARWLLRR